MEKTRHHKAAKNRTTAFCRKLRETLEATAGEGFEWIEGGRIHDFGHRTPQRPAHDRQAVDVVGKPKRGGPTILIEVELRRRACVKNVIKVWRWADDGEFPSRFVLIQAFSKYYAKDAEGHPDRVIAEFVGKKMQKAIGSTCGYLAQDFSYRPTEHGKLGAGARTRRAVQLGRAVARKLRTLDTGKAKARAAAAG